MEIRKYAKRNMASWKVDQKKRSVLVLAQYSSKEEDCSTRVQKYLFPDKCTSKSEKWFLNSSWFWALVYDSTVTMQFKVSFGFTDWLPTIKVSDKSSYCITSLDPAKDLVSYETDFPRRRFTVDWWIDSLCLSLIKPMDLIFMLSWKVKWMSRPRDRNEHFKADHLLYFLQLFWAKLPSTRIII